MPIIPWRPFWDIERWFEEEWPGWDRPSSRRLFRMPDVRIPRTDVYETDKDIIAEIEMPGVDPKDIEVEVKDNVLRVEAKIEKKKEKKEKGYYRRELSKRHYQRAIPLPQEVIGEKAQADYTEGVLKVSIPKKAKSKKIKRSIKIKVKGNKKA